MRSAEAGLKGDQLRSRPIDPDAVNCQVRISVETSDRLVRLGLVTTLGAIPEFAIDQGRKLEPAADVTVIVAGGLLREQPHAPGFTSSTVVLLRNVTPAEVVVAMRAGAKGVHCLDCHLDDLPHTIRVVAAGGAGLAGCAALALATHFNGTSELMTRSLLSPQEQRILRMLAEGDANEEISMKLGIEVRTVKFHVSSILRKLGSRNRAAAVALAYRQGLVV